KGTTKAFGRLPQRVLTKTRIRSATKDYQFDDIYSQFNELTKKTEKFHIDAVKFRDNLTESLNHQVNIAEILITLYDPIKGSEEGAVTRRQKTPVKSMKAVEEYEAAVIEVRELILPELDTLDVTVISPAKEFLNIIKMIKKTISKRDHKKTDYDRFQTNLKKLQDKKEKSSSEEKQMFKLEEQFSRATQEYDHYNNLLKEELPLFFEYRSEFIEPVFENFYTIQLNVFTILFERLELLVDNTGEYFDIETDIIEGYERKREEIDPKIELLTVIKKVGKNTSSNTPKSSSSSKLNVPPSHDSMRSRSPNYLNSNNAASYSSLKKGYDYEEEEREEECEEYEEEEPPPPPVPFTAPKPKPKIVRNYVIALYDYDAQADGDLSFKKDDKIEVIERTQNINDWWKGRLNGTIGVFPASIKCTISKTGLIK
ncbi:185_t:CDS:2, partial [Diversispora eburnea]